jgi:hypothetical protein
MKEDGLDKSSVVEFLSDLNYFQFLRHFKCVLWKELEDGWDGGMARSPYVQFIKMARAPAVKTLNGRC